MYGKFHRHVAATAVLLTAMLGVAMAQTATPASQRVDDPLPSTEPSSSEPASAESATSGPAQAPATQPVTGTELLQVPLATNLSGTDAPIAEQLRNLVATKLARLVDRKPDRAAVEAFYRDRGFAPLWIADGAPSPRANQAAAFLRSIDADGLEPADYPRPEFKSGDAAKLAQDEVTLTNSILMFARHARTGRVSFSRVSAAIQYDLQYPEPADVLASMATAGDVGEALGSYHPQQPGYKALKAKLSEARQKKNAAAVDTLLANMERWRWLPRDLGKAHVTVNIPDYSLKVTNQGKTVWSTRIVAGKPGAMATPLLSETIKFITVNPTWNVPPSIIRNEYLPALQRDPGALARIGLKITHNKDGSIRIYQPPGARNALGRIRFNFPNKFLVYQHDTPDKHLFAKQQRAFSHGCMRVQNPEQYAEVLLSISQPREGYTAERVRRMYGDSERTINLKTPIPVHVTYQTAFVDDAGQLQLRPDVYGHDREIVNLLRGGRGAADTPIARNQNSAAKPVMARLPSRSEPVAPERRRMDRPFESDRLARRFEFGGAMFYPPPRTFGAPY